MSLRVFHIAFIVLSSTLALGLGLWVLQQHRPAALAAVCLAASLSLDLYLVWFLKKSKNLGRP